MGMASKITRNTGYVFFSGIVNKLISLIFIAYAARILGPSEFGLYALIGTFMFFFQYFGNLGIGPMAVREIARNKGRVEELFNHIISLRIVLIVLSYPILLTVIYLLGYRADVKVLLIIAGLSTIFSVYSSSFGILYMAFERFIFPSILSVFSSFLTTVVNIFVLYLGYGLKGIIIVSFFGNLTGAVISSIWVRKNFIKFHFVINVSIWKELLAQAMPYAILTFFQQANLSANTLLLSIIPGSVTGEMAIGYFKPASSVCQVAEMLPMAFRRVTLPAIAANAENTKMISGLINRSTNVLLILVILPLILVTTFFPNEIISLIFGTAYLPAAPALTILGWAYALQIFNSPVTVTLSAYKEIRKFIPWAGLQLFIDILFAVPLIIYYGYLGAAMAFLVSKVFETIFRNYLLQTILGIASWKIQENLKLLTPMFIIFSVIMIGYLNTISTVMLLILIFVLYAICIVLFHDFRQVFAILTNGLKRKNISMDKVGWKEL